MKSILLFAVSGALFFSHYAPANDLMELSFLSGCWQGELNGDNYVSEHYSNPSGGVILGLVKTVSGDKLDFFEFLRIIQRGEQIIYVPYPKGKPGNVEFILVEIEPDKAVFENLDYDFPQRITYRLLADNNLLTQIAGTVEGKYVLQEYSTAPVPCRKH
ncbi:MAG: DUF6265 family protein [Gammaproteobacteria bacterium]|nr:DUF6265 family protein [Gammaproteobacteria bacterium]